MHAHVIQRLTDEITMVYILNAWPASWITWATMASPIQLVTPSLKISSVYNTFSSRLLFLSHFIIVMFTGLTALHTILPLLPPGDHARRCAKELGFIRIYVIIKTFPTSVVNNCLGTKSCL